MGRAFWYSLVIIYILWNVGSNEVLSGMELTDEIKNANVGNLTEPKPDEPDMLPEKRDAETLSSHPVQEEKANTIDITLPPLIESASHDKHVVNGTVQDYIELSSNTSNSSETTSHSRQWNCTPIVFNEIYTNKTVILIEEANLTEILNALNKSGGCALMYFFLRSCRFSCVMSAKINVIGLFYPEQLPVIAVDVHKSPGLAAKYGIVGVPTTLLFYGKKPVAKFNGSASVDDLHLFIKETTGFSSKENISTVSLNNTVGPLPTTPDKKRDVYLFFSVLFLVFLSLSKIINTESLVAIRNKFYNKVVGYFRELQQIKRD